MKRWIRTLGSLAGALALVTFGASGAAADPGGGVLISLDGVTYSQAPAGSIFSSGLVLVPGASATGSFYVKNDSKRAAELRVSVADASSRDSSLLESLTLAAATPSSPVGMPVQLRNGEPCLPLLAGETIEPQSTTRIRITVGMAETVSEEDQGTDAATRLLVSLGDPAAPRAEETCSSGGSIPILGTSDAGTDARAGDGRTGLKPPSPAEGTPNVAPDEADAPAGSRAADTPPAAGGSTARAATPWLGIAAVVLGVVAYVTTRRRAERTAVPRGAQTSR